jgi:hypothetical protein
MKERAVASVPVVYEKKGLDAETTPDAIMNRLQQLASFPDRKMSGTDLMRN